MIGARSNIQDLTAVYVMSASIQAYADNYVRRRRDFQAEETLA